MKKRFEEWLAEKLGNTLSSMTFFYFCIALDLYELPSVIAAHSVIGWVTYISQAVIQLIALPILGFQQKTGHKHHESHSRKLDEILKHIKKHGR